MERLFNQSALGERDKWKNRPDYQRMTIDRACRDYKEVYNPLVVHTAAQDFARTQETIGAMDADLPKLDIRTALHLMEKEFEFCNLGRLLQYTPSKISSFANFQP